MTQPALNLVPWVVPFWTPCQAKPCKMMTSILRWQRR